MQQCQQWFSLIHTITAFGDMGQRFQLDYDV